LKQKEYIGFESIKNLVSVLSELSAKKIFLVTGKDSYSSSGSKEHLTKLLVDFEVDRFFDFSSNPKIEDVNKGVEVFKYAQCDTVIAVGGGSVIDMAKLINFFAVNNLNPLEYFKTSKKHVQKPKPLIAIPTTAGSGSEASSFAVLYVGKKKFSVDNKFVLPDVAIVDPALTMSLPEHITAVTGMDVLSQAIESYWSINSNDESKRFARSAIKLTMANLVTAVNNADTFSRLAMAKAAHFAGKAINITKTTASHAISYPLTSYFDIPHGHAAGLTLSSMFEYNAGVSDEDVLEPRGCEYVRKTLNEIAALLGRKCVIEAKDKIDKLMFKIGLETKLSRLGVNSQEDIETIIANSFDSDRVANNPRKVTRESLREILEMIY